MDQRSTPFADAVASYLADVPVPMSTPGHKRNRDLVGDDPHLLLDAPHHGGADTLRSEWGVLEEAEALAAAAFGADLCRFSHNGSTHPNQALCLATMRPDEPVLVSRTCHKSVYAGLILSGARPVWVAPDVDEELGLPLGMPVERVRAALDAEPGIRTAVLTEPSYVGVMSDVRSIADLCAARGVALVCDHAWAAHFGFGDAVPPSALALGADAVAVSTHKTLPSATPGALLLARATGRIDLERLAGTFDLLLTTSPSGALYATIDRARALMATRGPELLRAARALADETRARLAAVEGVRVVDDAAVLSHPSVWARDPLKLVVDVSRAGVDGLAVDRALRARGFQVEGADRRTLVPQLTVGDTAAGLEAFTRAFAEVIAEQRGSIAIAPRVATSWRSLPERAMTPREAFAAPTERVLAAAAVGRVTAEFAVPYPPGIPALAPGEVVGAELWERLREEAAGGTRIASASDPSLATLLVVR